MTIKEIYVKDINGNLSGPFELEIDAEGVKFGSETLTTILGTNADLEGIGVKNGKSIANILNMLLTSSGSGGSIDKIIIGTTEFKEEDLQKLLTLL